MPSSCCRFIRIHFAQRGRTHALSRLARAGNRRCCSPPHASLKVQMFPVHFGLNLIRRNECKIRSCHCCCGGSFCKRPLSQVRPRVCRPPAAASSCRVNISLIVYLTRLSLDAATRECSSLHIQVLFSFCAGSFSRLGVYLHHALSSRVFGRSALALKLQRRNKSSA